MSTSDIIQESSASGLPPTPKTSPDHRLSMLQILGVILLCLGWLGLIILSGSRTSGYVVSPPTAIGEIAVPPTKPIIPMPPLPEPRAWVATERLRLFDNPYQGKIQVEIGGGTAVHLTGQSPESKWSFITLLDGTSGWVRTDRLRISSDPLSLETLQLPVAPPEPSMDDFEIALGEGTPGGDTIRYSNGTLVFHQKACSGNLRSCHPLSFSDAEVEFQIMSTGNIYAGLIFRWWDGYGYLALIGPDKMLWVTKVIDDRPFAPTIAEASNPNNPHWTTWKTLYSASIDQVLQKNTTNMVRLRLLGDVTQIHVNDRETATVIDRSYEGGSICFYAFNMASDVCMPGEAHFSDFQIRQLREDSSYVTQTSTPGAIETDPTPTAIVQPAVVDPTPEPGSRCRFMHVVRFADSWHSIKNRYGVSMADIQKANQMDTSVNPECCLNPGKEPAQILCIP